MLDVQYVYSEDRTLDEPVAVRETRGKIKFELYRGLFLPEGVAALNSATAQVLAGGQWFQLWRGEVVSIHSPEFRGYTHGRIHRGPLVDQAPRPRNG